MAQDRARQAYAAALRSAYDRDAACIHGQPAGDLVRPWCDTPACPLCRRRHPVHWRHLPAADTAPATRT